MNPSQNNPSKELPPPIFELPADESKPESTQETSASSPEQVSQVVGTNPIPIMAVPSPSPTAVVGQSTTQQVANTMVQPTSSTSNNDQDAIEKEWVNKAKAIVNSTREDPHKQSEELTTLKADYMMRHYNKVIKLK